MKQTYGLWVLLIKLGPKLLTVGAKLIKGLSVAKVGLAAGSVVVYAYLFSWPFALTLVAMLFIHESGHIWAMKREGMAVKGIYFIPFLGAVALGDDAFPSRRSEVFIALMGPLWGLIFALGCALIYLATNNAFWAVAATWTAMINLFNLLPINPLDGGRVLKSIAFSVRSQLGFAVMIVGMLGAIAFSFYIGFTLVVFLGAVGIIEIWSEWKIAQNEPIEHQKPKMTQYEILWATFLYIGLAALLFAIMMLAAELPEANLASEIFR